MWSVLVYTQNLWTERYDVLAAVSVEFQVLCMSRWENIPRGFYEVRCTFTSSDQLSINYDCLKIDISQRMAYVYSKLGAYTCTGVMTNQYAKSRLSLAVSQLIVEFT